MKSCSSFVIGKVSVLNLFFNTSVLFINRFTLVCYGFKLLNHILNQWFLFVKPYFKQAMIFNC